MAITNKYTLEKMKKKNPKSIRVKKPQKKLTFTDETKKNVPGTPIVPKESKPKHLGEKGFKLKFGDAFRIAKKDGKKVNGKRCDVYEFVRDTFKYLRYGDGCKTQLEMIEAQWEDNKLSGFFEALESMPMPETEKTFGKGIAKDSDEKAVEAEPETERLFSMKNGEIKFSGREVK